MNHSPKSLTNVRFRHARLHHTAVCWKEVWRSAGHGHQGESDDRGRLDGCNACQVGRYVHPSFQHSYVRPSLMLARHCVDLPHTYLEKYSKWSGVGEDGNKPCVCVHGGLKIESSHPFEWHRIMEEWSEAMIGFDRRYVHPSFQHSYVRPSLMLARLCAGLTSVHGVCQWAN